MKKSNFILLFSVIFFFSAQGREFQILQNSNDRDDLIYRFILKVDDIDFSVLSLRKDILDSRGVLQEQETFYPEEMSEEGVVIVEEEGRDVVILQLEEDFSLSKGGNFRIEYLVNGIFGTKKEMGFQLYLKNSQWKVYKSGDPITGLHFVANRLGQRPIGVKEILIRGNAQLRRY